MAEIQVGNFRLHSHDTLIIPEDQPVVIKEGEWTINIHSADEGQDSSWAMNTYEHTVTVNLSTPSPLREAIVHAGQKDDLLTSWRILVVHCQIDTRRC
ncbi:hypothetical protein N6H05_23420 [Sphingobium sp. WTD-1]|uniref:hypothetical protein n=1 Tax=Sphingobium sp. WTD-1 TaxID=2979467 RepID=UPI0024DE54AC|nr:hypothetical protein [Sphingobium sp. WTD-1]WIA55929.1 hypothetical protein N6H05_23420 [Sphingobium sp. WTD-1]